MLVDGAELVAPTLVNKANSGVWSPPPGVQLGFPHIDNQPVGLGLGDHYSENGGQRVYVGSVNGKIVRKGMEAGRGVPGQGGFQDSEQRIYVEGKERGAKWAALSEPTELQVRGKTVTVYPGGVRGCA